jgi:hypothetical protein
VLKLVGGECNMRKAIASLLIGFFGVAIQNYAAPQENRPAIEQKVKKAALQAAGHAHVFYHGEPQFTGISGTSITYATNTSETVLKIDHSFYFHYTYYSSGLHSTEQVWVASSSAQGPWVPAYTVPEDAIAIVCGQLNFNPNEPYLLCALPWPNSWHSGRVSPW